ncbi:hypothetical protein [Echinococcus multilocularis]|uniref:Uncharacterized protein n=1 Tax=Echinococcus multilocularis TaxID=6211 RepID=A0A068Y3D5_ECHMU|nr:hypothetical protein [Echinococcus multilocularis]
MTNGSKDRQKCVVILEMRMGIKCVLAKSSPTALLQWHCGHRKSTTCRLESVEFQGWHEGNTDCEERLVVLKAPFPISISFGLVSSDRPYIIQQKPLVTNEVQCGESRGATSGGTPEEVEGYTNAIRQPKQKRKRL